MSFSLVPFSTVPLEDPFFGSLKQDYSEFETWFKKKANNLAYLSQNEAGMIDGFLYLKIEKEELSDLTPPLPAAKRLKVGTFKINAHGTKLGDRFVKKIFDKAIAEQVSEIYVTVFEKHDGLIKLLSRFGFIRIGTKESPNGNELVLLRKMDGGNEGAFQNYPFIRDTGRKFLLALFPKWHTRLLPESILIGEGPDIVKDISHTNSIQKIYLAGMSGAENLRAGDILVIYRTTDNKGPAHYRSVATSVCVVTRLASIQSFSSVNDFLQYCAPFSVFTDNELRDLYKTRKYPNLITFTYNVSLPKRVTRKVLIDVVGLNPDERWTCMPLTDTQFRAILKEGNMNENFVVH